jgi:integrase
MPDAVQSKTNSLPEGIDKLPSGKYRWRVTAGYRQGKQVRASGTALTLKQAKLEKAKAIADFERRVMAMPDRVTVRDYSSRWLEVQDVRLNTRKMYKTELGYALEWLGDMPLRDVRPTHIKDTLASLKNRVMGAREGKGSKNGATMSTRTLGMVRARLRSVFAAALADQRIYTNPVEATKRIKGNDDGEARRGIALDFDQASRLHELGEALYTAGVCRLWVAVFAALSVGLRRGEVMGLRWQDIDLEQSILKVRQNLTLVNSKISIGKPKTRQSIRDIPMPPSLKLALEQQHAAMLEESGIRGEKLRTDSPVFATVTGEFTSPDNLKRALQNLLEWSDPNPKARERKAKKGAKPRVMVIQHETLERRLKGVPVQHRAKLEAISRDGETLPRITPHDLRHTAGTQMLRRKMPLEVVSKILGHAKVSITLDVYRHVLETETKAELVDLFPIRPARVMPSVPMN